MTKKIYITRKIPDIGIKKLQEKGYEIDIYPKENPPTKKEIIKALRKKPYDAVLTLLTDTIDKDVYDAAPQAKIFANYAVGFNNVDIDEAKKRGIIVTNTPGCLDMCVAEHAIAHILALTTRLVEGDRIMRDGKYKGWSPMMCMGTDLSGKTIGIIGAGAIGTKIAEILHKGFGVKIVYTDPKRNEKLDKEFGAEYKNTFEEVLPLVDIVSLHVPLIPSTHHMINERTLSLMKKTAFLINTSRGPVIDENALVSALQKGVIAGAGLDVYEFEPKLAKGLVKLSNVVLTPHTASAREGARNEMSEIAANNIISFFETGSVPNKVN